ncbi:hypothetical protein lerEdw1_016464 [Lerista edwardsae]|nr:hypothetical protein lerEdw1_016464 [Lerista edwardsae]
MDSLPGEDPTLPLEFNSSINLSRLPDISGDDARIRVGGGGALPDVAEDTVSPTRARSMKDFENQIIELRKENFNLKLRIYFLEERMQQKFDGSSEEVYRINIELKVELESLKRELREREQLLIKASKAVESLAQGGDGEVQRLKEEARKRAQHVEGLTTRISLLEEASFITDIHACVNKTSGGDGWWRRRERRHFEKHQVHPRLARSLRVSCGLQELKTAHEEMEKAMVMTEQERLRRMAAEQQLSAMPKMQLKDLEVMAALEEKDRRIEELSLSLQDKDALIQHLEAAKSRRGHSPTSSEETESHSFPAESLSSEKIQDYISALEEKERELEALQEELQQREGDLSLEKRNALKRDKTIQGLTLALKTKEKEASGLCSGILFQRRGASWETTDPPIPASEQSCAKETWACLTFLAFRPFWYPELVVRQFSQKNDELNSEVQNINAALVKAREATHAAQMQTFKGTEGCQTLLKEKESLLVELRSQNHSKDLENRKLLRRIKRIDQELNDLRLERERLMKELDEAQLQKSKSDKMINDLRNQLEKAHVEIVEKEKAVEHHYAALLRESSQKLQSQESVIAHLTDGAAEKDRLLQEINGTIREKEAELQQWVAKFHGLLKAKEELQRQSDQLVKETLAARARQPAREMIQELESCKRHLAMIPVRGRITLSPTWEAVLASGFCDPTVLTSNLSVLLIEKTKESEYAEVMEALRKERDVFASLVESLKDADGVSRLQEELSMVVLLRKQLEEDILTNWNLRKVLENPLKVNRREEETISSLGDQTSYMSICLREQDPWIKQIDQLPVEELRQKVFEFHSVVKELRAANEGLRRRQLEFSKLDILAKERPVIFDQSEFLEETEESRTLTGSLQDETITLSGPFSESSGKVGPSPPLALLLLKGQLAFKISL